MSVDYKYCKYLSPHNYTKYTHLLGNIKSDQTEYI